MQRQREARSGDITGERPDLVGDADRGHCYVAGGERKQAGVGHAVQRRLQPRGPVGNYWLLLEAWTHGVAETRACAVADGRCDSLGCADGRDRDDEGLGEMVGRNAGVAVLSHNRLGASGVAAEVPAAARQVEVDVDKADMRTSITLARCILYNGGRHAEGRW